MFTIYTNNEVLELDTLAEALEECEFLQVESSGNAEIILVDETGNELCQIDGSIKQLSIFPENEFRGIDFSSNLCQTGSITIKDKSTKEKTCSLKK